MNRQKHGYPGRKLMRIGPILMGVVFLFLAGPAWSGSLPGSGIKVVTGAWPTSVFIDLEAMAPFGEKFTVQDPNFKKDGPTLFTGIRLTKLMALAGAKTDQGVTAIGYDQYVGYLPGNCLDQGFLVWEMDNRPVPGLKGGPLKLMFLEDACVHASCYTWYLTTLVAGPVHRARLLVTLGKETKEYQRSDFLSHAVPLDRSVFSIAQGCRNKFKDQDMVHGVHGVKLSDLIPKDFPAGRQTLRFVPFTGPAVTLESKDLNDSIFVLVGVGGNGLHPALGGPFSVIFPVETHPELTGRVPESGALFFLERILVQ